MIENEMRLNRLRAAFANIRTPLGIAAAVISLNGRPSYRRLFLLLLDIYGDGMRSL